MENFFEEMYFTGIIKEDTFDHFDIPMDVDSKGNPVSRTNDISRENRHQAKILTSVVQKMERRKLVNEKRISEYQCKKKLFDAEQKNIKGNAICERKLVDVILKSRSDQNVHTDIQHDVTYNSVHDDVTLQLLKSNVSTFKSVELKSFIRVRSARVVKKGRVAYMNVPVNKDNLMKKCVELKDVPPTECLYEAPVYPSLLPIDFSCFELIVVLIICSKS